ncbi:hypothetical protein GCM10010260_79630 [Streptomyces filipinensis]|uniref:Uncharacterized protein n=1 Tax=Streptomyces filipinensis TaxID=66887 RepID=A0A918IJD8_9ACTN|nr:hypothetical protein [Streptomyces filipinensis]GGV27253.1 hypothetical protein GCM10010260_79630 [Streptomyces filipinensis]
MAGASTVYGIPRMERTDVPGLATRTDGRWDYPPLVRPPLPAGSPAPFTDRDKADIHYADLRGLVLPAPVGAKADAALAEDHGRVNPNVFLAEFARKDDRDSLRGALTGRGLRHIAARGWTMPDGTRTRICLLQFETGLIAELVQQDELSGYDGPAHALRGAPSNRMDDSFRTAATDVHSDLDAYAEKRRAGPAGLHHRRDVIVTAHLAKRAGARPRKLGPGSAVCPPSLKEHPVEIFFEALLALVCAGVLAFAGLTVKKLYQGQR